MAVRDDIEVSWHLSPRIVLVKAPSTDIAIADLHDTLRMIESAPENLDQPYLIFSAGKQPLGGGVYVGITATLQNALLAFEARSGPGYTQCVVNGGNLVASDINGDPFISPIAPTPFTQIILSSSSSATIADREDVNIKYLVESMRKSHNAFGNVIYWSPHGGDDALDGLRPSTAVQTWARAQDLVTDGNGDVIFIIASDPDGHTEITYPIEITKSRLNIRGPGKSVIFNPISGSADTISIMAEGVCIEGVAINTFMAGATRNAIRVNAPESRLSKLEIADVTGNGIHISSGDSHQIQDCWIEDVAGNGIFMEDIGIDDCPRDIQIADCTIYACDGYGVCFADSLLSAVPIRDNKLQNITLHNNSLGGIYIGLNTEKTVITDNCSIEAGGPGATRLIDFGTETQDQVILRQNRDASAVWDHSAQSYINGNNFGSVINELIGVAGMKNVVLTAGTFDGSGNMLTGILKVYATKADADVENVLAITATYAITSTYDGLGRNTKTKQTKNP